MNIRVSEYEELLEHSIRLDILTDLLASDESAYIEKKNIYMILGAYEQFDACVEKEKKERGKYGKDNKIEKHCD